MKDYEEIKDLEYKLYRAVEQKAFFESQLEALDRSIELKRRKLEEDVKEYNKRAKKEQEIIYELDINIDSYNKRIQKLLEVKIKEVKKEEKKQDKIKKAPEKSPEQLEREELEKRLEELKKQEAPISKPIIQPTNEKEPPIKEIIEEKRDIANQMREVADDMNGETDEIERLQKEHPEWIQDYAIAEGGKAIWQGRITNGFRQWLIDKNRII